MAGLAQQTLVDPSAVRYHGLDALRAWAMSMGIVLHAAWIMIDGEAGAPMTDASATEVVSFVSLGIHTFRMQLFFVLAGLFACLLLGKRGMRGFAVNRILRILVPLIVFTVVFCPIVIWQYKTCGLMSGAIQSDKTAWQLTREYLANLGPGNVMLLHLWFLYYLCLAYILFFSARFLVSLVDPDGAWRNRVSDAFGKLLTSPRVVLVLAGLFVLLMMLMDTFWGIDIDLASLHPKWPGLISYLGFFTVGWLIFRNIDKLAEIVRGWRWQLLLGFLLFLPYYYFAKLGWQNGYSTWSYPALCTEDFRYKADYPDYVAFRERLVGSDPASIPGALWRSIPESYQRFVQEHETATTNQLAGVIGAINAEVLGGTVFTGLVDLNSLELSEAARSIGRFAPDERSIEQNQRLNRELIDLGFEGVIYSEDVNRPHYYLYRAGYSFLYSTITWLLIFGCIGFSQHHFDSESRFWRYFSDSSYWFYLAHLPIQFQILIWFGQEPWHWLVKFAVYVFGTLAVLLPTYHLLVRPTPIGWMLNGRMASVWNRRSPASPRPLQMSKVSQTQSGQTEPAAPSDSDTAVCDEQRESVMR